MLFKLKWNRSKRRSRLSEGLRSIRIPASRALSGRTRLQATKQFVAYLRGGRESRQQEQSRVCRIDRLPLEEVQPIDLDVSIRYGDVMAEVVFSANSRLALISSKSFESDFSLESWGETATNSGHSHLDCSDYSNICKSDVVILYFQF